MIPLSPEALQALKGINADAQPTPAQLENIYQTVWQEVSDNYNRPEKLANWQEWKHKFDGKLKTPDELESALQEMLNSLGDHWTSYTSTADMKAARERYMNGILESGIFLKEGPEGSILIHSVAYGTAAYKSSSTRMTGLSKSTAWTWPARRWTRWRTWSAARQARR